MVGMPPDRFGGPPPGVTPQGLSSMKVSPMQAAGPQNDPNATGGGAGIAKMFYDVEQKLDELAGVIPDAAVKIDEIKMRLREIMSGAVSNGAAFQGAEDTTMGIRNGPSEPLI
jgi:hypothetical protein